REQERREKFAAPSGGVNERDNHLHFSERAGQFMQIVGGEPTNNLLKLIRPELRLDVRTALYQVIQNRDQVQTRPIDLNTTEGVKRVNIIVRPVLREGDPIRGFILILFQESKVKELEETNQIVALPAEPIAHQLEEELMHARSQLRTTVEQYEIQQEELRASNEALEGMNEELRSA